MISRIRQRLRMIRYYSAPRRATPWSRAMDMALMASLVLALPLVWAADLMVIRPTVAMAHSGLIHRLPNGSVHASLVTSERDRVAIREGVPIGNFQIQVLDHYHGWPLTTGVRRQPARLDLDLREEPAPRPNVSLAHDDPLRRAIAHALERDEQHSMLHAWRAADDPTLFGANPTAVQITRTWYAWALAAGIWWILLTFASFIAVQGTRFGWMLLAIRRLTQQAQFRAEGKCLSCGYDMTGLEFNERCPECGNLVW